MDFVVLLVHLCLMVHLHTKACASSFRKHSYIRLYQVLISVCDHSSDHSTTHSSQSVNRNCWIKIKQTIHILSSLHRILKETRNMNHFIFIQLFWLANYGECNYDISSTESIFIIISNKCKVHGSHK